jgi:hypothetical protein
MIALAMLYAGIGGGTALATLWLILAAHRAQVFTIEPWRAIGFALWAGAVWPVVLWRNAR